VGAIVATLLIAVFIGGRGPVVPGVAVLPFEFLSDSEDDQYLAYAFQEEVIRTLHGAKGLVVKPGRRQYPDLEVSEVGEILGVDTVLFGTLQREADMLKVSYRISDVDSGADVGGGDLTGKLEGIFALQEQFANMVRKDLLGETEQQLVSASRPANYEAYDRYLRGLFALDRRSVGTHLDDAIELFEETTRLDPLFGPAYLALAKAYALLPDYRHAPPDESHKLAIETVERGIAIDESIRGVSRMIYGFVYNKQRQPLKAEEAYKQAIEADVVDTTAFNWYARMLASVGRSEAALEQALAGHRLDPSSSVINTLVATMYIWLEDEESAARYYERSSQLGAGSEYDYFGYALMLMRQGRLDEAFKLARTGAAVNGGSNDWVEPLFAALQDRSQAQAAIAAMDEVTRAGELDARVNMALRVFLGDVDGAMRVAKELAGPGMHRPMDMLFLPELRPLREHPEFFELMEMLGVKQYWDEKGCVWLDDSVSCPE
jgi:TolB-like protein/Tfp pilus assembly protein PilF